MSVSDCRCSGTKTTSFCFVIFPCAVRKDNKNNRLESGFEFRVFFPSSSFALNIWFIPFLASAAMLLCVCPQGAINPPQNAIFLMVVKFNYKRILWQHTLCVQCTYWLTIASYSFHNFFLRAQSMCDFMSLFVVLNIRSTHHRHDTDHVNDETKQPIQLKIHKNFTLDSCLWHFFSLSFSPSFFHQSYEQPNCVWCCGVVGVCCTQLKTWQRVTSSASETI